MGKKRGKHIFYVKKEDQFLMKMVPNYTQANQNKTLSDLSNIARELEMDILLIEKDNVVSSESTVPRTSFNNEKQGKFKFSYKTVAIFITYLVVNHQLMKTMKTPLIPKKYQTKFDRPTILNILRLIHVDILEKYPEKDRDHFNQFIDKIFSKTEYKINEDSEAQSIINPNISKSDFLIDENWEFPIQKEVRLNQDNGLGPKDEKKEKVVDSHTKRLRKKVLFSLIIELVFFIGIAILPLISIIKTPKTNFIKTITPIGKFIIPSKFNTNSKDSINLLIVPFEGDQNQDYTNAFFESLNLRIISDSLPINIKLYQPAKIIETSGRTQNLKLGDEQIVIDNNADILVDGLYLNPEKTSDRKPYISFKYTGWFTKNSHEAFGLSTLKNSYPQIIYLDDFFDESKNQSFYDLLFKNLALNEFFKAQNLNPDKFIASQIDEAQRKCIQNSQKYIDKLSNAVPEFESLKAYNHHLLGNHQAAKNTIDSLALLNTLSEEQYLDFLNHKAFINRVYCNPICIQDYLKIAELDKRDSLSTLSYAYFYIGVFHRDCNNDRKQYLQYLDTAILNAKSTHDSLMFTLFKNEAPPLYPFID